MARFRSASKANKPKDDRPHSSDSFSVLSSASTMASSERHPAGTWDTGFPELPRTTNWRHPDADTSPGACITAADIDVSRSLHRQRKSFLNKKYKRTTSHGFIAHAMEKEHLSMSPDSAIDLGDMHEGHHHRHSKDGSDSIDRTDESLKEPNSATSPTSSHFDQSGDSPRRRSFFSRLRNHHN